MIKQARLKLKSNSLYIASMEPHSGKLLITLGMMEMLSGKVDKIAFFRPIIDETNGPDNDIKLIRNKYCPDMTYEQCYGFESEEVKKFAANGNMKEFYVALLSKFKDLQKKYDFVVCEALNSSEFLASFDIKINFEIAKNLGCPFVAVINGKHQSSQAAHEELSITQNIIKNAGCHHVATFINRLPLSTYTELHSNNSGLSHSPPVFFLPEEDELDKPTLADIQKTLNATCFLGSQDDLQRIVKQIKIATMTIEHFLNYIEDGDLIIVGGDRADILLASIATLSSHNYPNLSGILLTGGFTPEANMMKLLQGFNLSIPVLSVSCDTFKTTQKIEKIAAEITFENQRKIALSLGLFESHVNNETIYKQIELSSTDIMTPIMFEHKLFEWAKTKRMNIVLPEASDERILRATEILLRRKVVNITLLGNKAEILAHSTALGLNIQEANIIEPMLSERLAQYTETLFQLRQHKGMTKEMALDAMTDGAYFATMMVYSGEADGMVSGAIHTTANTIRPALQTIKTSPGISVVSSVFLMCLETKVLVYGDCAVNPDPNSEQLAEIAISSAETASMFAIEPRVAMLSYSTGASGKGKDVDKVRQATQIAQKKCPDLLIEGPIQYDAAISPDVARTKLPDSKVAGHASVFIFPDLNTGNNTYKAVQRSSGAIAIGPILQGLNKPVNDLSRGCLVADIINTVAITAVQAQSIQKNVISGEPGE